MEFDRAVLLRLREAKKLSQKEVAEGVKMKLQQYNAIETGRNTPKIETINRIATFFKVPGQLFLKG